jgi:hypothetical protein
MPAFRAIASHERAADRRPRRAHASSDARLQEIAIEDERIIAPERLGFSVLEDAELISADDRLLIPMRTCIRMARSIGVPSTKMSRSR